jgi:hypothetical protein
VCTCLTLLTCLCSACVRCATNRPDAGSSVAWPRAAVAASPDEPTDHPRLGRGPAHPSRTSLLAPHSCPHFRASQPTDDMLRACVRHATNQTREEA